jgi:predicted acylesterase/phospholipase RssA
MRWGSNITRLGAVLIGGSLMVAPVAAGPAFDKQRSQSITKNATKLQRPRFSADDQLRAAVPGFDHIRFWADSAEGFAQALPTAGGPWLALSGGGDDGAFGAGYLAGWSESSRRPEFAVVTGVSTGALMAPFVFLGPDFDDELRNSYTTTTAADVFEVGDTPESLLDDWPLKKTIDKRVTPELLRAIAAEHRKGRRLFVVTSNLDAGRPVVWNMGAIAAQGGDAALKLFRQVLLASSSIPGIFQPVHIDVAVDGRHAEEMHVDGTVTAPFYVAPERVLAGERDMVLPMTELYVVANSRLQPDFHLVERSKLAIVGRFISIALKEGMRMEIARAKSAADRLGIALNVISVPESFTPVSRKSFDPEYMSQLYALGVQRGRAESADCLSSACRTVQQAARPKPESVE